MNKLEELINKLCPNGVEYKKLSELCNALKKGTLKTSDLKINGKYPVINSGRELYGFYDEFNNKNAITVAARGEYAGYISYFKDEFWAGGLCYPYSSKDENVITNKFLYYYLKSKEKIIMESLVARGSIPALNKTDLDRYMIAVPPMKVQCEIVRILDDFTLLYTELSSKLSDELKIRRQQYEYYRDALVNKEKNSCLSDVLKIKNGKDYKSLGVGNIPVYGTGGIMTYTSKYAYDKPSVLIPRKGSLDKLYYVEEPFWNVDTIFYTEINERIAIPKYVFYCLENEHLEKLNTAGGVPSLTQTVLNKVEIYIPSIDEQKEIVSKLDSLYSLVNETSKILQDEIEKRKKQYEYYMDKLLSFKEVEVNE